MEHVEEIPEEEYLNCFFINVVKKYPALYAKGDKSYQNATKKERLWLAVSNEVKMSINDAKKKWKNLRDRYLKELRRVEQTATSGAGTSQVNQPKLCLYQELSFLSGHCKRRSTASNYQLSLPMGEVECDSEIQEGVPEYLELEEIENDTTGTPSLPSETPYKRKRKADAVDEHIHQILNMVGNVTTSLQGDQPNRHKEFCTYLGQRISALPIRVARDLEVEFTARVNELLNLHTTE